MKIANVMLVWYGAIFLELFNVQYVELKSSKRLVTKNWFSLKINSTILGMTPVTSNTCYDALTNCPSLAETQCWRQDVKKNCGLSCGLCKG